MAKIGYLGNTRKRSHSHAYDTFVFDRIKRAHILEESVKIKKEPTVKGRETARQ